MRVMSKLWAVPLMGMVAVATAQANVVYNWQPKSSGQFAGATEGSIEVTDSAFQSGRVSVDYKPLTSPRQTPLTEAGVFFTPTGGETNAFGASLTPESLLSSGSELKADLTFKNNGYLTGNLHVFNSGVGTTFRAKGANQSWSVFDVGSDFFTASGHCTGATSLCSAGTGFWALDESTVPDVAVPAPPVWSLFLLSALGLLSINAIRLRRRSERITSV